MKRAIRYLILAAVIGLMQVCGSDQSPTDSSTVVLHQAMVNNPHLATQLTPLSHLDPLDNHASAVVSATVLKAGAMEEPLTVSVADLEASFETMFCQLNSTHQVNLQSPQCLANISYIKGKSGTGLFDLT